MSKKLKTGILIGAGVILLTVVLFWVKSLFSDTKNLRSIYLIPKDATYFLATDDPIANWKEIKESAIWKHLKTNDYFAELTKKIETLDTLLQENKKLFNLLGSKKLLISAHSISPQKHDYLFVVDLKKTAKLIQFKGLLKKLFSKNFTITERTYKQKEITEIYDKKNRETLYLSVINNNLIASYTHALIEASIEQMNEPVIGRDLKYIEVYQNLRTSKMFQVFVQYTYIDDFVKTYTHTSHQWIQQLGKTFDYSGFNIHLNSGTKMIAGGYTNLNENNFSYLQAIQNSGLGKQEIAKVAPRRTSLYVSFGFESYLRFYKNYQTFQQKYPAPFKEVEENKKRIEKLLEINLQEHFIRWIADEIALLKLEPNLGANRDFALVLKVENKKLAKKNIDFILQQIKKKMPVKFKEVAYKNYPIHFMSIKGFFKTFFGGYFKDIETPYFTMIDDFVIFSNHPNTLKYIITNYIEKNTLSNSVNYTRFKSNFDTKSNLFAYINTPLFYEELLKNVDSETRQDLRKNRKYFTAFSQLGIQLFPIKGLFKSKLIIQYQDSKDFLLSSKEFMPTVAIEENDSTAAYIPVVVAEIDEMEIPEIHPPDLNTRKFSLTYPNGQLRLLVKLKNGKKHGRYREYYENGKLRMKGHFRDDKRTGRWKKYNMEGKMVLERKY